MAYKTCIDVYALGIALARRLESDRIRMPSWSRVGLI
jgi:hypothetical protein